MTRMLFSFCLWVVVARWAYSEVQLVCPPLVPYINKVLTAVEIPTHDKWPKERLLKIVTATIAQFEKADS
jgi:hypothetical protein